MSQQITAPMGGEVELGGSWTVEWDAVDPTTGATVSGVEITAANVTGADLTPAPEGTKPKLGPFMLIPGPQS